MLLEMQVGSILPQGVRDAWTCQSSKSCSSYQKRSSSAMVPPRRSDAELNSRTAAAGRLGGFGRGIESGVSRSAGAMGEFQSTR